MVRVTSSLNMVAHLLATTKPVLHMVTRAILLLLIAIRMTTPAWACKGGLNNVMWFSFCSEVASSPIRSAKRLKVVIPYVLFVGAR